MVWTSIVEVFPWLVASGTTHPGDIQFVLDGSPDISLETANFLFSGRGLRSFVFATISGEGQTMDWPSTNDLGRQFGQSDGLYIYAETLVRFIDDEYGGPAQGTVASTIFTTKCGSKRGATLPFLKPWAVFSTLPNLSALVELLESRRHAPCVQPESLSANLVRYHR